MISKIKPRIGQPMSIRHSPVSDVTLVFYYQELIYDEVWKFINRQTPLVEDTHYELDAFLGHITLLDHSLWGAVGHWRAADREEPLLYKGAITYPQYIEAVFEFAEEGAENARLGR